MSGYNKHETPRYKLVQMRNVEAVECPCGMARRAFCDDVDSIASLHIVDVTSEARTHYHKKTTEIYYVLEGHGSVELDGVKVNVSAGSTILIKPGCRHRAIGHLKILNVPIPAFDSADEWFD